MYLNMKANAMQKFWVVWKICKNECGVTWLTKGDCPTKIHNDYLGALAEADRLATKTGELFVVMEARDIARPPQRPTAEVVSLPDPRR